jgi:hypothetical protein
MPAWSSYSYTFDNPLKFIDPTGRDPEDDDPGCCSNRNELDQEESDIARDNTDWAARDPNTSIEDLTEVQTYGSYSHTIGSFFTEMMNDASGGYSQSSGQDQGQSQRGDNHQTSNDVLTAIQTGTDVVAATATSAGKLKGALDLLGDIGTKSGIVGIGVSAASAIAHYEEGTFGWKDMVSLGVAGLTGVSMITGEGEIAIGVIAIASDIYMATQPDKK